ncbi:MAG: DUF1343 domain-containing protein [Bdellovibrionota bacterium]
MKLGLEKLLTDSKLMSELAGRRVSYLGHPASVDANGRHGLDLLKESGKLSLTSAFGPQHGMRGEKQDNMIESEHYRDPDTGVIVYSLYSEVRRPTPEMIESFDVLLVDMQDVGCRVYTYLTTLLYMMEACAKAGKALWVLDRPNPAGRPAEGFLLDPSMESFVGASRVPLRHGLTLGEIAKFLKSHHKLNLDMKIVAMDGYKIHEAPGYGWPVGEVPWINPSPNMPTVDTARCYGGTVLLEGTLLSEGRGTTRPLQIFGAPGLDSKRIIRELMKRTPRLLETCFVRSCFFEPTFHKFKGQLCEGLQIHVDTDKHYNHDKFQPFRLMMMIFRLIKEYQPELMAWRQPPYEYEKIRLPIDLLIGDVRGREWADTPGSRLEDLDMLLKPHESEWAELVRPHLLY